MPTSTTPTYLRRYTDLPALLHMLASKEITLLDPKTWDDRNDAYFMSLYKDKKGLKTVLALCFSQSAETYHHWRVFSDGPAGVCIAFDRNALVAALTKQTGVRTASVDYLTLNEARKKSFKLQDLPFLKRFGFKPENEFRVVYTSKNQEHTHLNIAFQLACIRSISLSPWMHSDLSKSTVSAIRAIDGCQRLKVSRSTLISNEQWKTFGRSAT